MYAQRRNAIGLGLLAILSFLAPIQSGCELDTDSTDSDAAGADGVDAGDPAADHLTVVQGSCIGLWADSGAPNERLGSQVLGLDDLDRDGRPDIAVLGANEQGEGSVIQLRSGHTGAVLRRIEIPADLDVLVNTADLDGDGLADIAAAGELVEQPVPPSGPFRRGVWALSSGCGSELWARTGPEADGAIATSLAPLSDRNGDGIGDLAMGWGAASLGSPGRVTVLSGSSGREIERFEAPAEASETFGAGVVDAGDLNGDGVGDLFVSDPYGPLGRWRQGVVSAISGSNGSEIWSVSGDSAQAIPDRLGFAMRAVGDLDGDGATDLVAGAPGHAVQGSPNGSGYVLALSGRSGTVLWVTEGTTAGEQFGISVASSGDVTGDQVEDILVGASSDDSPSATAGRVLILNGRDGEAMVDLQSSFDLGGSMTESHSDGFGRAVDGLTGLPMANVAELVIGAPGADVAGVDDAGYVIVLCCAVDADESAGDAAPQPGSDAPQQQAPPR